MRRWKHHPVPPSWTKISDFLQAGSRSFRGCRFQTLPEAEAASSLSLVLLLLLPKRESGARRRRRKEHDAGQDDLGTERGLG